MPLPRSERVVYDINPLVEVSAELRFERILRVEDKPSQFQELVRHEYPKYHRESFPEFPFPAEVSEAFRQIGASPIEGHVIHRFSSDDDSRAIIVGTRPQLDQSFLALTERKYERWETFLPRLEAAERHLRETYDPGYYTRVGFRYQDRIDPTDPRFNGALDGKSWAELLSTAVAGLLSEHEVSRYIKRMDHQAELTLDDDGVPGGLMRIRFRLAKQKNKQTSTVIIDTDCFKEGRIDYAEIPETLDRFHTIASSWFRHCISEITHVALRPGELKPI